MTVTELMPAVQKLSKTDKLLLVQLIIQGIVDAESGPAQSSLQQLEVTDDSVPTKNRASNEEDEDDLTIEERIAFLRKPIQERRAIMAEQAEALLPYYQQDTERKDWPVDDIIEY